MKKKLQADNPIFPILLLGAALLLRLLLGYFYPPYPEAMAEWAERIWRVGFADFYGPEVRWPYPPLYLYVLWISGGAISLLKIEDPLMQQLIIKLPAILCDIAAAGLIYRYAKKMRGDKAALICCALWCFNPAVIHNSAMWGQTDACFSLFIALMLVALCERRLPAAFLYFGISLMLKQQSLTFAPVLLVAIVEQVFLEDFSIRRTLRLFAIGLCVIAGMVLISLPFGLGEMLAQYLSVQGGMPYASVDAFNFWALIGRNWAPLDSTFLHLPCKSWGSIAIVGITLLSFLLAFLKKENRSKYPLLAAFLILSVFCFGTGMHERYMLSGLLFLLLALIYTNSKALLPFYAVFSLLQLSNTVAVYAYNLQNPSVPKEKVTAVVSAAVVLCTLFFWLFLALRALRVKDPAKSK
ncbi:MAG: hypothetical protein K6E50_06535 [Lachnospiraceae bacterium]|nr:hypothetical protein [Lachnospiraceae bacterium]